MSNPREEVWSLSLVSSWGNWGTKQHHHCLQSHWWVDGWGGSWTQGSRPPPSCMWVTLCVPSSPWAGCCGFCCVTHLVLIPHPNSAPCLLCDPCRAAVPLWVSFLICKMETISLSWIECVSFNQLQFELLPCVPLCAGCERVKDVRARSQTPGIGPSRKWATKQCYVLTSI